MKYKHLTQEERYHIAALKKAKFSQKYIANEIGVNEGTISRELKRNSSNTPQINRKLAEVDRLWKIVHKFYNNIEKGGLPLIVFNTTDNITNKMDEITKMYISLHK